jgi:hypothetical protein
MSGETAVFARDPALKHYAHSMTTLPGTTSSIDLKENMEQ